MLIEKAGAPLCPAVWRGTIHSVFAHSCNAVTSEGRLVTFHSFAFGTLPRSYYVPALATGALRAGDPVAADTARIRLGSLTLRFAENVETIDTRIPARAAARIEAQTARRLLKERRAVMPETPMNGAVYETLYAALGGLLPYVGAGRDKAVAARCKRCVGLGFGLTPSGDDMLLGMLCALHMYRPALAPRLAAGIRPYLANTNDVSRHYLALAADGYAATPVTDAASGLSRGGTTAFEALLSIGHSSGADILDGLLLAADYLAEQGNGARSV